MELILFALLGVLLVFMFVNTNKRKKQMAAEQEKKQRETVPGAKVLLQGGLYGTIAAFDPENLEQPALVELAPGTIVEVHSQAILRVIDDEAEEDEIVDDEDATDDGFDDAIEGGFEDASGEVDDIVVETPEETRARLERGSDDN